MAKPNLLNSIKLSKPKSNFFDLTHDVKLSTRLGLLTPVCVMETVPGDKFKLSCESLVRFAPMVAPVMQRYDVSVHYFFVPNRIIYKDWEKFITGNGTPVVAPYIDLDQSITSTHPLCDYMGIPSLSPGGDPLRVSALPFAAYQKIYEDYYRDQNLITENPVINRDGTLDSGDNSADVLNLLGLKFRCWEHDYFTSCLPFAQKGADVSIPFEDARVRINDVTAGTAVEWDGINQPGASAHPTIGVLKGDSNNPLIADDYLYADMTGAAGNINDMRHAFRLQEWLEKNARAGTRYVESILAHFGVKSSDARLQRPEYITGMRTPVVISEVLNTSGSFDPSVPGNPGSPAQGNMSGHGISVGNGYGGSYYCEEHGYILGIMSVMPKTSYQQGLAKHWLKTTNLDYYWPSFAHIGEQEVKNVEIYADDTAANRDDVFGYLPRYAEYKYIPNRIAGDFANTLDHWHHGRIFATAPALNEDFIKCTPDERVFAVTDPTEDKLYCHVLNKVQAQRPMPKFGTPSF